MAKEIAGVDDHIQISLNNILQEMFPEIDLKANEQTGIPVTVNEMELLAFLRMGNYEKVEIFYQDGKMKNIEGMQRLEVSALITDVIKQHTYQRIEVVVENGKSVSLRRTVKKQINKKG